MKISPEKHEDRSAGSYDAVDIARANLSYGPPNTEKPWRKIAGSAIFVLFAVGVALLASHVGHLIVGAPR